MKKLLLLLAFFFISSATFAQATANFPNNMVQCDSHIFDFTTQNASVLGAQNPAQYTVTYFLSQADAVANVNAIANPTIFTVGSWMNVFVRVTNISNGDFATSSFVAYSSPNPLEFNDETVCDAFQLMPLPPFSEYFSGPNGTGQNLLAGQFITATQTVYIRTGNGGCNVESSFVVTVLSAPEIIVPWEVTVCDAYALPELPTGNYYTGPGGTGSQLMPGDVITSSMVIYVYATSGNGQCVSEGSFDIFIGNVDLAPVADVSSCNSYVLPALDLGNYYTSSNGTGTVIFPGNVITESMTIFVFVQIGPCTDEESFQVTIGLPNIVVPLSPVVCTDTPTPFAVFDLAALIPEIVSGQSGIAVTFHETYADVEMGTNPVANPSAYMNITPYQQTIFVRVSDGSACQVYFELSLTVQLCTDNIISGNVSISATGCESATPAAGVQITNTVGDVAIHTYTNANGDYSFVNAQEGINTISIADVPGYSPTPSNYEISVTNGSGNYDDKNFCVVAIPINDVAVNAYPVTVARPGFQASYALVVSNVGTTTLSGNVSFTYDEIALNFMLATPAEISGSEGILTFEFTDLVPLQTEVFIINFLVEVPPTVNAGYELDFESVVSSVQNDENLSNNTFSFGQAVVNSYDPNDKTVVEGEYIGESQTGNYLNYIVRFQNTGTASAINVKITDQLDPQLDLSTFRPVSSSHYNQVEMTSEGMLTFKFDNINLPATQDDEPGSHGYVAYQVKPIADWTVNPIENTANIYFDFNEPIITNTVSTSIVHLNVDENNTTAFALAPNPASSEIMVGHSGESVMNISVTDMQGKTLLMLNAVENNSLVDVSMLSSGIYFVNVTINGKSVVKKLVKE